MAMKDWEPISKYVKRDNVQPVGSHHMFPGIVYVSVIVDFNNKVSPIRYYYNVSRVIRYPARLLYWIGKPILPYLWVFIQKVLTLDRPIFASEDYREAAKSYKDYYDKSDVLSTTTTGGLYTPHSIPDWIDKNNKEQLLKYARGVLRYSSLTSGQINTLIKKYLNSDVHYINMDAVMISILADITPPGDIVNNLSNIKKEKLED